MLRLSCRLPSFQRLSSSLARSFASRGTLSSSAHRARSVAAALKRQVHSEVTKSLPENACTAKVKSQPPWPVRLALVGSSVTLATPAFTVAGMYRIWTGSKLLPEAVKNGIMVLIGGSTFTLFYQYIIPNILEYSSVLLPFALSNGIACMVWQGVGEAVLGTQKMATLTFIQFKNQHAFLQQSGLVNKMLKGVVGLPVGGAAIGVLAALTAPLLWPMATSMCWAPDMRAFLLGGDDLTWLMDAYFKVVIPVGIPVGFVSGLSLHQVLQPVVLGVEGTAWYALSLPVLGGISLLCVLLYRTLLPGGAARSTEELMWVKRRDPVSGGAVSVNLATKEVALTHARAEKAEMKMSAIEIFHSLRRLRLALIEMLWTSDDRSGSSDDPSHTHRELPAYSTATKDFKLGEIVDVENLYKLIDILVRYKYLEMQGQGGQTSRAPGAVAGERLAAAKTALEREAAESLQLTDVAGLYHTAEKLCILRKAMAQSTAAATSGSESEAAAPSISPEEEASARTLVEQEVAATLLSHRPKFSAVSSGNFLFGESSATSERQFERAVHSRCEKDSSAPVRGHRAVSLLSGESLSLLEEELEQKLSYIIKPLGRAEEQQFILDHHHENRMKTLRRGLTYLTYSLIPVLGYYAVVSSSK